MGSTKPSTIRTGILYDAVVIIAIFLMLNDAGRKVVWPLTITFVLFLIPFASRYAKNKKVSFAIAYALAAWIAWTEIITVGLIEWMNRNRWLPEHSVWDMLAFLLPFLFAIASGYWAYKKRHESEAYNIGFLMMVIAITLFH